MTAWYAGQEGTEVPSWPCEHMKRRVINKDRKMCVKLVISRESESLYQYLCISTFFFQDPQVLQILGALHTFLRFFVYLQNFYFYGLHLPPNCLLALFNFNHKFMLYFQTVSWSYLPKWSHESPSFFSQYSEFLILSRNPHAVSQRCVQLLPYHTNLYVINNIKVKLSHNRPRWP